MQASPWGFLCTPPPSGSKFALQADLDFGYEGFYSDYGRLGSFPDRNWHCFCCY